MAIIMIADMNLLNDDVKKSLIAGALNYDNDKQGFNQFVDELGWDDWMDEFFDDSDYPTYNEEQVLNDTLKEVFDYAHKMQANNEIITWRKRAGLTMKEMSEKLNIPVRTIENWNAGNNFPPEWAKLLLVEKLKKITEEKYFERMTEYANSQDSDENGNRPVVSWATIKTSGADEFIDLYGSMEEAMSACNVSDMKYYSAVCVACILVNKGTDSFYCDCNNDVASDYEGFKLK